MIYQFISYKIPIICRVRIGVILSSSRMQINIERTSIFVNPDSIGFLSNLAGTAVVHGIKEDRVRYRSRERFHIKKQKRGISP